MTQGRFFSNKAQYSIINIGNEQFHAVAVALIDSLQTTRVNDEALKKILKGFSKHFPTYMIDQQFETVFGRMKTLLDRNRKSELVECMAYILRQLTVDELYASPLKYRKIFDDLSKETPKSYLRNPETKLPARALNALAHALGITIILSFKEHREELRMREIYTGGVQSTPFNSSLTIQVQGGEHYFPRVKHERDFAYVGKLPVSPPVPKNENQQEGTLAEIITLIDQDNNRLLQSYDKWIINISSQIRAGELTYEQLINLYTTFYPKKPASFSVSELAQSSIQPVMATVPIKQEEQVVEWLVSRLADWLSTEQIPEDLFDQVKELDQAKEPSQFKVT